MRERWSEIRDAAIERRNEVQSALIAGARKMKSVATPGIGAHRIERSGSIRADSMECDHHAWHRKHSVSAGSHYLTGDELRPGWNLFGVRVGSDRILRDRGPRSKDERKQEEPKC